MGGCIGVPRSGAVDDSSAVSRPNSGGLPRKNQPLIPEPIRWKSDVPLTLGQLLSKRDEFWDTAPAFDGRPEVWNALRAAAAALEASDAPLAQAILDGAGVSAPRGHLTECYDELGARYAVPIYCLSPPVNLVSSEGDDDDGDDDDDDDEDNDGVKQQTGRESPEECSQTVDGGREIALRVRVSSLPSASDVRLAVQATDSIGLCKKRLQTQEGVDVFRQRWFYGGKLLGDKLRIEEAKIPSGHVVQVIVNTELTKSPISSTNR